MFYEEMKSGKFRVGDCYTDPLTGKKKKAFVTYEKDIPRLRKQAERDLQDKIEVLIHGEHHAVTSQIITFQQLRDDW